MRDPQPYDLGEEGYLAWVLSQLATAYGDGTHA